MLISAPSKNEINNLIKFFNEQNFEKAITLGIKFTKKFPKHPFGWKALGAIYSQTGNTTKAITANLKSIELNPKEKNKNISNVNIATDRYIENKNKQVNNTQYFILED